MSAVTPADVIEHLAFETPFTAEQITGRLGRNGYLAEVRAAAALLISHLCPVTNAAIGAAFGLGEAAARRLVQTGFGLALRDDELLALVGRVAGAVRAVGDDS